MSESEEMYLITLTRLAEKTAQECVSMPQLAEEMHVLPVSANQMVRKLERKGLVSYLPYQGVLLTTTGKSRASQVLRQRRLWETFLVQRLQFSADEANRLACRLEHVTSAETADRLSIYLEHTHEKSAAQSLPAGENARPTRAGDLLSELKLDERGLITSISGSEFIQSFLAGEGMVAGQIISIMAIGSRGAVLIQTSQGRMVQLSAQISASIQVQRLEKPHTSQSST